MISSGIPLSSKN